MFESDVHVIFLVLFYWSGKVIGYDKLCIINRFMFKLHIKYNEKKVKPNLSAIN